MATFTLYTYLFSPVTTRQGELFPEHSDKTLNQLHAERHRILGKFFNSKSRYFSLHTPDKDYGCMMLANQDGVVVLRIANEKKRQTGNSFQGIQPERPALMPGYHRQPRRRDADRLHTEQGEIISQDTGRSDDS